MNGNSLETNGISNDNVDMITTSSIRHNPKPILLTAAGNGVVLDLKEVLCISL